MSMGSIKGSSMMVKMADTLVKDGWSFIPNELDVVIRAENKKTGESVSFPSIGNLKNWLYEKALS